MEDLKPCPFCGGTDQSVNTFAKGNRCVNIICYGCNMIGPQKRDEAGAIAAWNTRAAPPETED